MSSSSLPNKIKFPVSHISFPYIHSMQKQLLSGIFFLIAWGFLPAQQLRMLHTRQALSLRGLSVVSDKIIWVSGTEGNVGLSNNGGKTWKWIRVPHYEKSDFRDIEAFSAQEAVIMGITEPAVILRTVNGGKSWTTVFEDSSKSVFLDAMDFSGDQGALVGDPENGRIFFAQSPDRGKTWKKTGPQEWNMAAADEAFFASSGSNLVIIPAKNHGVRNRILLVSGGSQSCLYTFENRFPLSMSQGRPSTGANSIAFNPDDPSEVFIVGGDFKNDTVQQGNSLRVQLNPFEQIQPSTPPHGYRSSVIYIDGKKLVSCGTSGVDISVDGGMNWKMISRIGFHVCRKSRLGNVVFLAGPNGSIAKLKF